MPSKARKLIIGGDTAFAEIAYEYFTHDSDYEVVAFTVEREYLKRDELFGLPILPFETLEQQLDPAEHSIYVASVYTQLNRLRTRLMTAAKAKGFSLASYVSSRAWANIASSSKAMSSSRSSKSETMSSCGAAITSATIPRSATIASSPRTW
jgi:hypothetical protein